MATDRPRHSVAYPVPLLSLWHRREVTEIERLLFRYVSHELWPCWGAACPALCSLPNMLVAKTCLYTGVREEAEPQS